MMVIGKIQHWNIYFRYTNNKAYSYAGNNFTKKWTPVVGQREAEFKELFSV